jgi:MFS family permease
MPIYLIYLVLNVKLIYMPIINDDHFLSYCSALVTVSAVVGAPFWGYIGDLKGFKFSLLMLVITDSVIKLFGIFCVEKWNLALLFFLLGVNDKGMITIIGPGLIGMFGIEMATELVPYKGLAVFLGYVIAPTFQMLLWNILSLQKLLFIYFLFSIIGLMLSLYLNFRVHYKTIDPSKDE